MIIGVTGMKEFRLKQTTMITEDMSKCEIY